MVALWIRYLVRARRILVEFRGGSLGMELIHIKHETSVLPLTLSNRCDDV